MFQRLIITLGIPSPFAVNCGQVSPSPYFSSQTSWSIDAVAELEIFFEGGQDNGTEILLLWGGQLIKILRILHKVI